MTRPRRSILVISAALLCPLTLKAQSSTPQFKDYEVKENFTGRTAPLILSRAAKMYKTRLREAAKEKPNFAGHFIVTYWGCGSGCVEGAIIDARTGNVFMLPHTLCCWGFDVDDNFKPIEYRAHSKLIILTGARNEKEGDNATRFYKFENNRLIPVRTVPR